MIPESKLLGFSRKKVNRQKNKVWDATIVWRAHQRIAKNAICQEEEQLFYIEQQIAQKYQ